MYAVKRALMVCLNCGEKTFLVLVNDKRSIKSQNGKIFNERKGLAFAYESYREREKLDAICKQGKLLWL